MSRIYPSEVRELTLRLLAVACAVPYMGHTSAA